ncbi:MAG: LamG domain-containing protein [Verrucomicrobiota bacterium]|nr:LamG domain-containing protein [Verrucomicrobiota bacterium]
MNCVSRWDRLRAHTGGEDVSNGNGNYMFLSPAGGTNLRFSVRDPATNAEPAPLTAARPLATDQEILLTVVYDYTANVARLYSNAVLVASGPAPVDLTTITYVNNWLGRSQWNDAMFRGKYNEFRIWDGVLLPDQVAAHYAAGPDSLEPNPTLSVSMTAGKVVISWPATSPFTLEQTTALGPTANWSAVDTSGAVVEGNVKKLAVSPSQSATFYRMKK